MDGRLLSAHDHCSEERVGGLRAALALSAACTQMMYIAGRKDRIWTM